MNRHVYAGPIEFGDQYLTVEEYAKVIGRSRRQVYHMAQTMVFADFGIPIISIPRSNSGRGPHRTVYIFSPASVRS